MLTDTNRRLEHLIGELRRAIYDKKSEKRPLDDRQLAFEDLEGAVAEAEEAAAAPGTSTGPSSSRRAPRRNLGHLPGAWNASNTSSNRTARSAPAGAAR